MRCVPLFEEATPLIWSLCYGSNILSNIAFCYRECECEGEQFYRSTQIFARCNKFYRQKKMTNIKLGKENSRKGSLPTGRNICWTLRTPQPNALFLGKRHQRDKHLVSRTARGRSCIYSKKTGEDRRGCSVTQISQKQRIRPNDSELLQSSPTPTLFSQGSPHPRARQSPLLPRPHYLSPFLMVKMN